MNFIRNFLFPPPAVEDDQKAMEQSVEWHTFRKMTETILVEDPTSVFICESPGLTNGCFHVLVQFPDGSGNSRHDDNRFVFDKECTAHVTIILPYGAKPTDITIDKCRGNVSVKGVSCVNNMCFVETQGSIEIKDCTFHQRVILSVETKGNVTIHSTIIKDGLSISQVEGHVRIRGATIHEALEVYTDQTISIIKTELPDIYHLDADKGVTMQQFRSQNPPMGSICTKGPISLKLPRGPPGELTILDHEDGPTFVDGMDEWTIKYDCPPS